MKKEHNKTFLSARKEAWLILLAWAVCLVWTVGYSTWAGTRPGEIDLVLGIPGWVFWGVAAPWLSATAFSVWFSLFYMADDDLEV